MATDTASIPRRTAVLRELDGCCDALPRSSGAPEADVRVEEFGSLRLFVRTGAGWPLYARPVSPDVTVSVDDVRAVRARQRLLGVPQAFEWIDDLVPSLTVAARSAALDVQHCPLLVLDEAPAEAPPGVRAVVLDADSPDLAAAHDVAAVAFGGAAGVSPERLAASRAAIRAGRSASVIATLDDPALPGPLASGALQHAAGIAEVVGVATLPQARRRGLGGAVAAALARHALERGMTQVFLSAQDEAVARVYERVGFRRIGTSGIAAPPDA